MIDKQNKNSLIDENYVKDDDLFFFVLIYSMNSKVTLNYKFKIKIV